jgi:hypothetical protein
VTRLLLAAAVVVCVAGGLAGAAAADPPPLYVVFHTDHTFFAYLANGTPVGTSSGAPSVISAGTYKLILDDTPEANSQFDLAGPGVKFVTNMSFGEEGSQAVFQTFQPSSTYTFRDDNHPSLFWTFTTSADIVASSPTTTTTCSSCTTPGSTTPTDVVGSQVVPNRGALAATVDTGGRLALTYKGKSVATLKAGRYTITVVDRSATRGFTLQELRRQPQPLTTAAMVGKRSRAITLIAGQWLFFSPGGKKSYFIVVKS